MDPHETDVRRQEICDAQSKALLTDDHRPPGRKYPNHGLWVTETLAALEQPIRTHPVVYRGGGQE